MAVTAGISNKTLSHFIHCSTLCLSLSARLLRCFIYVFYCVVTWQTCSSKRK
jgi:hypothetical protein